MPLVLTMMLGMVLAALGSAMAIGTATETMIAGAYRNGTTLFYAADAGVEWALGALAGSGWSGVLRSLEGSTGYQPYADAPYGDVVGRSAAGGDPYLSVWIADLTDPPAAAGSPVRVVGIRATASGTIGKRTVELTARLTSADEGVIVERISWAQVP